MFNEMNMLLALTIDSLPHSSSPVIGSVISYNLENLVYVIMSDTNSVIWILHNTGLYLYKLATENIGTYEP